MHYRLANREAWAAFDLIQPLGLRVHVTHRTHDAMRLKASVGERTLARIGKSLEKFICSVCSINTCYACER